MSVIILEVAAAIVDFKIIIIRATAYCPQEKTVQGAYAWHSVL